MRKSIIICFASLLILSLVSLSYALDKIELFDGTFVEGEITEIDGSKISIDTGIGMTFNYYLDEVRNINGQPPADYSLNPKTIPVIDPVQNIAAPNTNTDLPQNQTTMTENMTTMVPTFPKYIDDKTPLKEEVEKKYYFNGSIYSETTYLNKIKNGPEKKYYVSGQISEEATYADGLQDVITKTYYENGETKSVFLMKKGEAISFKYYYMNGALLSEGTFVDDKLEGEMKFYDKKGYIIQSSLFDNGLLIDGNGNPVTGEIIVLFETGEPFFIRNFKNGLLEGRYQKYYENGNLEEESIYKDGNEIGVSIQFYESGHVRSKTKFQNDEIAVIEIYDKNGALVFLE